MIIKHSVTSLLTNYIFLLFFYLDVTCAANHLNGAIRCVVTNAPIRRTTNINVQPAQNLF